jgi:hypothetical protein
VKLFPLSRIMHERPSRVRGDGRATGQPSRGTAGLGPEAYWSVRRKVPRDDLGTSETRGRPAFDWARRSGAGGRVVCGAKRIRSHYLPSPTERRPGLSTRTPPKGPASLSTINDATMRLCRADLPASRHLNRAYAARREGQPYPRSQQVVRAQCGLSTPSPSPAFAAAML